MKKILDSKFLFIIALSLIVLLMLGVLAFYLYRESDTSFLRSGYVLNPLSAKVEKYYFEADTDYRENLSSMIEFKDVDKNEVAILKESFLHYDNSDLSFLKDGAILDLGSVNGKDAVKFYNITKDSMIEKKGSKYQIANGSDKIELENFIGRISDNKYIVVGNLEAKIPGNNANVKADYFEIVYTEEGVINIENNDIKYQVTAEGTVIYAGDVAIDLGTKGISKNGENVMSLTAITINGDENIEIVPKKEEPKDDDNGNGQNQNPNGVDNQGNNNQGGTGNDNQNNENGGEDQPQEKETDATITLKEVKVGSTNVDMTFGITDISDKDKFTLKVSNLDTGRTVDIVNNVKNDEEIMVNLLSPQTKYLFTLVNEKDDGKYFQKIFETKGFGIELTKKKATDSTLTFNVSVGDDTDIRNAKISLYKYNEDTKQNEIVKSTYRDPDTGEIKEIPKVVNLSSLASNISGNHEVTFDMLDSNTIYTAVIDEFSIVSTNFKDVYNINLTAMTLKKTPGFENLMVNKDVGNATFKLAIGGIDDSDGAITKYTYLIYDRTDLTKTAIDPITMTNASTIELRIGEGNNELKNDTNYFYKVVIEYFDNEKNIEYITTDSINFVMGTDPYITVIPDTDRISYDAIAATIYLIDNSCLITMPGREKCDGESTAIIDVSKINAITGDRTSVYTENIDFAVSDNEVKYNLYLDNLQAGTTYTIDVRAIRNDLITNERTEIMHTEESKRNITTKTPSSFINEWHDLNSGKIHVVNISTKLIGEEGSGTLDSDTSAASIEKVILKLYAGDHLEDLNMAQVIATKEIVNTEEFNIKENMYDAAFNISSDEVFGLDIDDLRDADPSGLGKLSEYYTIAFYAYYDTTMENEVRLGNNIATYKISPILLMDNVNNPIVNAVDIPNRLGEIDTNLLSGTTTVGYKIIASFDRSGLLANHVTPSKVRFFVYDKTGAKTNFYILNGNTLKLVDTVVVDAGTDNYFEQKIYLANGTDYYASDNSFARGNEYYVGYYVDLITEDGNIKEYPENSNTNVRTELGIYCKVLSEKENPTVSMYIAKSTANSITYRYLIKDPDNALYKEKTATNYGLYYIINDGEEKTVDITKTDAQLTTFAGDATISGLSNNDVYQLYYKWNLHKTGTLGEDVKAYYDGEEESKRLFDGYYDVSDSAYHFEYSIVNKTLSDNKVTIRIGASDNFINRIVSYRVKFTDSKNNVLEKELWNLDNCPGEEEDKRCFSVDYLELKNAGMKSENNQENIITVEVKALYDNGLMGYDYTIGDDGDYPYIIMQDNNTSSAYGTYLAYSSRGQLTQWTDAINMPKGYYRYTFGSNSIGYRSMLNSSYNVSLPYTLGYSGYTTGLGTLNPKMISIDTMTSDNNTFSFSSITPKVNITKTTSIINGAVISMQLSGADVDDFCENASGTCVNTNGGDKYVYVEVWENSADVGEPIVNIARNRVAVKINNDNTSEELTAIVDKLADSKTYYYRVYAYLNVNKQSKYTQLFDAATYGKNEGKTYIFKSLEGADIFKDFEISYAYDDDVNANYNDKVINTKINLKPYKNNVSFNYDIKYCFVDPAKPLLDGECSNVYDNTINSNDLLSSFISTESIKEYNLEFDKDYAVYIYAIYKTYVLEDGSFQEQDKVLALNNTTYTIHLNKLTTPEFIVSREAGYNDGNYYIDFTINVKDPSKVLNDGIYYVNLLDTSGNLAGILQVKNNNNAYETPLNIANGGRDYLEYPFDASVTNKSVRITGLSSDTKYTVVVHSEAYIDNYNSEDEFATLSERIAARTVDIEKSHTVYTTNQNGVAFGNDILYSATERSIVVTFLGGSSFDNVMEVSYTIGLWDNETSSSTFSGTYDLVNGDKRFEMYLDTEEWRFVIDPDGMFNVLGQTYIVALQIKVRDTSDPLGYHIYRSDEYPGFVGRTQYVKDNV